MEKNWLCWHVEGLKYAKHMDAAARFEGDD